MIRIGLVLPDVLGTYGDNGNALVLRQRARMRHLDADIVPIHLGEPVPDDLSVYTLGGGEDVAQRLAIEHLRADGGLERAVAAGRPVLAICAGLQILGHSFDGVPGLGLLDVVTVAQEKRAIGEVQSVSELFPEPLTGFENHLGGTTLGPEAKPLARVTRGVGNGDGESEGVVQGSIVATYMHGPVLARNPQLADWLLEKAVGEKLAPLDIPVVDQLRLERLQGKAAR